MKQFDINGTFKETIGYLKSIFGETIGVKDYQSQVSLPRFLQTNYALCQLEWNNDSCVLLRPLFAWRLPEKNSMAFSKKTVRAPVHYAWMGSRLCKEEIS